MGNNKKLKLLDEICLEMNNTIGCMSSFLEILGNKESIISEKALLQQAKYCSFMLKRQIEILNYITEFEHQIISLDKFPIKLQDVILKNFILLKSVAEEKGIKLNLEYSENIPSLMLGDSIKINEIINGFLDLAISSANKEIKLKVQNIECCDSERRNISFELFYDNYEIPEFVDENELDEYISNQLTLKSKIKHSDLSLMLSYSHLKKLGGSLKCERMANQGTKWIFNILFLSQNQCELLEQI